MLRLDINLVFTLINILILYIVVKKFLFGPVNAILAKRKELIEGQFKEVGDVKKEADSLKEKYEASMSGMEEEKERAKAEARKDAKAEYDRIVCDAQSKAEKIVTEAAVNARTDREKLFQKAQGEITGMVMEAAAKVVAAESGRESDRKLYEQFLVKAGDSSE